MEEMFGEEKILVAKLKLIILGKSWDLLAYVERIRVAHPVLRKLQHKLRHVNGPVIDLDDAV